MCKSEIFATIMKVVSTENGVSESLTMSDCKINRHSGCSISIGVFSLNRADYIHFYRLLYTQN